jgi:Zn-finger nucleic acid-binding protein
MPLTCPRCNVTMTEEAALTAHGPQVTVDICPQCKGLWLDAQKLAAVCPTVADLPARKTEILLVGQAGTNIVACPRCEAVPYEFALMDDMLVDFCPQCHGVWLDGDEYEEGSFAPVAAPQARERSPYRAAADKLEKKSEVDCQDCARPTVIAKSYIWEYGFICRPCYLVKEQRATHRRAALSSGPLDSLLDGLFSLLAPPPGQKGPF